VLLDGTDKLKFLKAKCREKAGLSPVNEVTIEVTRTMRTPLLQASTANLIEAQQQIQWNWPLCHGITKQN